MENMLRLLQRAESYRDLGDLDKALACYKLVLGLETSDIIILRGLYVGMAKAQTGLRQYEQAIESYRLVANYLEPSEQTKILIEIGRLYQFRENYPEAIQHYRRALSQSHQPEFLGDVIYWLGESLYKIPEFDSDNESLKLLSLAKAEKRNLILDWEIHNTLGNALVCKHLPESALDEFRKALAEDIDQIDVPGNLYNNVASCYKELGLTNDAISWYRRAILAPRQQTDTEAFARMQLGVLLQEIDPKAARKELEEARKLFEKVRDSKKLSVRWVEPFLLTIRQSLDKVKQSLRKSKIESIPPVLPPIQFYGSVGVGINMGTVSQVNKTIGEVNSTTSREAAEALKALVQAIGNSKSLDDSKKNEFIETANQIGQELKKPVQERDKSKKFTLEGVKTSLDKVVDVAEVAGKVVKILLPFFI